MTNQQHSNKQKEKKKKNLYTWQKQIYGKNKYIHAKKTSKKTDRMFVHTPKLK
jgi:hypothetical protein